MNLVALLLIGGVLAIGLPHVTRRSERRFWHPWMNAGLLPLVVGLAVGPFLDEELRASLEPVLALATAAAGVLAGSQLRMAYLRRAGALFLRRHSLPVLLLFHLAAIPTMLLLHFAAGNDWWTSVAWAGAVGGLVVASSERPPMSATAFDVRHRDVVLGHVAPAGWWNLLALILAGGALSLTLGRQGGLRIAIPHHFHPGDDYLIAELPAWSEPLFALLLPAGLGLVLGWLAKRARNRDEATLFLLAVLGVAGGAGLLLGSAPIFVGLIIGAVFANLAQERAAAIERALEGLEQPVVVATGLLAGLSLRASMAPLAVWVLVGVVLAARWIARGWVSPTSAVLSPRGERRLAPPGATGVLILGALVSMGEQGMVLVPPLAICLVLLTGAHDLYELRMRRRALA